MSNSESFLKLSLTTTPFEGEVESPIRETLKSNTNDFIFIKTDENKILNKRCITWVRKMNDCLEVCTKSTGCRKGESKWYDVDDTHKICKKNSLKSYEILNKYFE